MVVVLNMPDKKIKICFIGANPYFNGGIGLYQKNLIKYIKENKNAEIDVIYFGKKAEVIEDKGVKYIQIKNNFPYPLDQIIDNIKIINYLKNNNYDIINSHALWGFWMNFYKKRKYQKLVHTYHGVTYNYFKVHIKRFSILKKILFSPMILFGYILEKPPIKKADEIISVSQKVKNQLNEAYNCKRKINVIRTGVDLKEFKPRDKEKIRKKLNLENDKLYGLYIGKGGYWIKGLDRAIKISEEIYKKDRNYRMIIVGADYKKIKDFIKKDFIIYLEKVDREEIKYYYNVSDFLFYLSRYDGGAPTLVVSEAMASGCPIIFSKDSQQEIIKDKENGIIIDKFNIESSEIIMEILKDRKLKEKIIKNEIRTIKELSLDNWGEEYIKILRIN
ncbi:glycosyltransferase family 4 protein [Candidatus Pacearchaeota archaeon]|jgi:glycosyltransferase involved in cell wall biosynthesis|nr:glycosyltransferase family 4 protein [Candidatus Pacearchaeota archaeon]